MRLAEAESVMPENSVSKQLQASHTSTLESETCASCKVSSMLIL